MYFYIWKRKTEIKWNELHKPETTNRVVTATITPKRKEMKQKKTKSKDIYTNCQLKYVVVINMLSVCSRKTKIQNINARTCSYTWMYVYIFMYENQGLIGKCSDLQAAECVIFTTLVGSLAKCALHLVDNSQWEFTIIVAR